MLLLFSCHCRSTITGGQQKYCSATTTRATERSIYLNCSIFLFNYSCCYCVILLFLFLFICSCGFTITHEEKQQHETVTTTRTTQTNLHKLLNVEELISAIHIPMYDLSLQQLNMKMSKQMWSWPDVLHLATRCLYWRGMSASSQ